MKKKWISKLITEISKFVFANLATMSHSSDQSPNKNKIHSRISPETLEWEEFKHLCRLKAGNCPFFTVPNDPLPTCLNCNNYKAVSKSCSVYASCQIIEIRMNKPIRRELI